jgi:hypothetical protein
MKKEKLYEVIGEIDDNYINDAHMTVKKKSRSVWVKWGAMAACLCLIVAGMVTINQPFVPSIPSKDNSHLADVPNNEGTTTDQSSSPNLTTTIQISLSAINVNEFDSLTAGAPLYYDPALYDSIVWTKNDIFKYYGKGIVPNYIPDGLSENLGQRIVVSKDGKVCSDTVVLLYYHEFDETGTPVYTDAVPANHGFTVTVSKLGLLSDCCYILPDDEVKQTDINGVMVTFGYRAMPYQSATNAESAYYDLYVAEFEIGEISYQIVAEQMSKEDVVKVVSSVIYGTSDIKVVQ